MMIFYCQASLRMVWDWFAHTVVYTCTRCLAHNAMHCLHHFEHLVVHNIDSWNVGPPPCLSPRYMYGALPIGPFSRDYGKTGNISIKYVWPFRSEHALEWLKIFYNVNWIFGDTLYPWVSKIWLIYPTVHIKVLSNDSLLSNHYYLYVLYVNGDRWQLVSSRFSSIVGCYNIPYFHVIRCISLISAYSPISAYCSGFHPGFLSRGGGANTVIAELRGGNNYSSIFRDFHQRGKIIAHS